MRQKLFIGMSVTAISCLAVVVVASTGTQGNINYNVGHSEATSHTIVMNKDTIVTSLSYRNDGATIYSYAYFQLKNPGNYTTFISSTYFSKTIGGNHLYETAPFNDVGGGVGFAVDIYGIRDSQYTYYFDSAKNQKIYLPGIDNITQIEITFGSENTAPFNEDYIRVYNNSTLEQDLEDPNTYRITNIPSNINSYYVVNFTTTEENINQKLVIDQIKISYIC